MTSAGPAADLLTQDFHEISLPPPPVLQNLAANRQAIPANPVHPDRDSQADSVSLKADPMNQAGHRKATKSAGENDGERPEKSAHFLAPETSNTPEEFCGENAGVFGQNHAGYLTENPAQEIGENAGVFGPGVFANPVKAGTSAQIPRSNTPAFSGGVFEQNRAGYLAENPAEKIEENAGDDSIDNEVFRIEMEFVTDEEKRETSIRLRLRSRFAVGASRPSFMLGTFSCGFLTKAQVKKARAKTLPPKVREALAQGDLEYELITRLLERPGKGRSAASRQAANQNRTPADAVIDSDQSGRERGQAGTGDNHQEGGFLDGGVSSERDLTVSNRIQ